MVSIGGDVVVRASGGPGLARGAVRHRNVGRHAGVVSVAAAILVVAGWATAQMALAAPAGAAGSPVSEQWNEVAVPRAGGHVPDLSSISCTSAGLCAAVGSLLGEPAAPVAVIDNGGRLEVVTMGLLPAGATSGQLTSVSCVPTGNCVAAGWASEPHGGRSAFTIVMTRSGVGSPAPVPGMARTAAGGRGPAISCPSATWCLVVGQASSGPVALAGVPGSWRPVTALAGVADTGLVDCEGRGRCVVAAGTSSHGTGSESLTFGRLTQARWHVTVDHISVPSNTSWLITGLSCPSAIRCEVAVTGTGSFPGGAVAKLLLLSVDLRSIGGPRGHRSATEGVTVMGSPYSSATGSLGPFALTCPPRGPCQVVGSGTEDGVSGGLASERTTAGWLPVPVAGPGGGHPAGLDALWCSSNRATGHRDDPDGRGRRGAPGQAKAAPDCIATGEGVVATLATVSGTELPTGAAGGLLLAIAIGGTGLIVLAVRTRRMRALRPATPRA